MKFPFLSPLPLVVVLLGCAVVPIHAQQSPTIVSQPENLTLVEGDYVYFDVVANGTEPLSYQWRKNGGSIVGATDAMYVKDPAVVSDGGAYTVRISNTYGAVTSIVATLTVLTPPSITTQPLSKIGVAGSNVTFTVRGAGSPPLSYQWYRDQLPIDGATSTNLTLTNLQTSDAGEYFAIVSNPASDYGAPNAVSEAVTLTVWVLPSISDHPDSLEVSQGDSGIMSVLAEGTDTEASPLTYQWVFKGHYILAATDTILELIDLQPGDEGDYYVIVANGAGSVQSSNAFVTVNTPPVFTLNPASRTVWPGSNMIFYATATGTMPIAYQWYFNDSPIEGATNTACSVWIEGTQQRGRYTCLASNLVDDTWSTDAYLTVKAETVKPTVGFISPVNGGRWSNAIATVIGYAADNGAIDHVEYRDNAVSGNYKFALSISNSWTNWMAVFPAKPGTNRVDAASEDDSANRSTTETMFFFYVVPSPFTVVTNGPGTASTNLGDTLEIGRQYILTAVPGVGSVFSNWTGGYVTNHPTIRFMMQSNLVLNMNFTDIQDPTVTVTNPLPSGARTGALASVHGAAADNWRVASVRYQINEDAWATASGTSNWLASVTLKSGTNTFRVYSLDAAGRASSTNTSSSTVELILPRPMVTAIERSGEAAYISFTTISGLLYNLEFKNSLTDETWTGLSPSVTGTGTTLTLPDTNAPSGGRYYRVRAQ